VHRNKVTGRLLLPRTKESSTDTAADIDTDTDIDINTDIHTCTQKQIDRAFVAAVHEGELYIWRVLAQNNFLMLQGEGLFGFLVICILCIGYLVREYMCVCKREMYSERVLTQHDST